MMRNPPLRIAATAVGKYNPWLVTARQKRFLVAVVDDDRSLREALGSFLKSAGFRVRAFASAEAFIASGVHISLRCLITDLQLPGSSGFQLHEQLERAQCRVPTIFITGAVDLDGALAKRGLTAGRDRLPHEAI
jgi:FixJ family two-component response regulator